MVQLAEKLQTSSYCTNCPIMHINLLIIKFRKKTKKKDCCLSLSLGLRTPCCERCEWVDSYLHVYLLLLHVHTGVQGLFKKIISAIHVFMLITVKNKLGCLTFSHSNKSWWPCLLHMTHMNVCGFFWSIIAVHFESAHPVTGVYVSSTLQPSLWNYLNVPVLGCDLKKNFFLILYSVYMLFNHTNQI